MYIVCYCVIILINAPPLSYQFSIILLASFLPHLFFTNSIQEWLIPVSVQTNTHTPVPDMATGANSAPLGRLHPILAARMATQTSTTTMNTPLGSKVALSNPDLQAHLEAAKRAASALFSGIYIRTYTDIDVCLHNIMYIHKPNVHNYIHVYIQYIRITYIHTYIHIYIHTYIHTYIPTYIHT